MQVKLLKVQVEETTKQKQSKICGKYVFNFTLSLLHRTEGLE